MKTLKELTTTGLGIIRSEKSQRQKMQGWLCDMIEFGQANDATGGDVLAKVYNELKQGQQQKIKAFIEGHSQWKAVKKGEVVTFKKAKGTNSEGHPFEWRLDQARSTMWWEYSKHGDDDTKEYTLAQLVAMANGLAKRVRKQVDEGKAKVKDADKDGFEVVLAQLQAIKAPAHVVKH